MIYIPNESTDPYYNQAFEQAVFELYEHDDILLVWRNADAIVCGRNQNVFAEVSISEAKDEGVKLIRRDTGGGTVYHDMGNVNYTLISDANGLSVDYDAFLQRAVGALNKLLIPAHRNKACDIAIKGMKISGSAQRQTKTRVLHHGTLLFDSDLTRLAHFSRDRSEGYTSKSIASARSNVTNIALHTSGFKSTEQFMQAFTNVILHDGKTVSPTSELLQYAEKLKREKYMAWDWTFGKNPAFTREAEHDGIKIKYSARRGVIDFFELISDKAETDGEIFVGEKLDTECIHELCRRIMCDEKSAYALYKMII